MKKNYYTIHKNKHKRKSTLTDFQKTWKILCPILLKAVLVVQKAMELSQKQPVPNYIKGGKRVAIYGMDLAHGADRHVETVVSPSGTIHVLKPNEKLYENQGKTMIDSNIINDIKNNSFEM